MAADEPVLCKPDATGEGWLCGPQSQMTPPPARAPRAAAQPEATREGVVPRTTIASDTAPVPAAAQTDSNIDPLTGLSTRPADWYQPTPPRPTTSEHGVQQGLAERYFVQQPTVGADGVVCRGYYQVRDFPQAVNADNASFPIIAEADQLAAIVDASAELQGNVTIEQGNRLLYAPSAQLDQVTRVVTFDQGVRLDQPGVVMQGTSAQVDLQTQAASLQQAQFLLTQAQLRGRAESLSQSETGDLTLNHNQFTRCEPGNNGWRMDTSSLLIEKDEVFGTARHAVVRLKSVPVFYTPYLKFPVSDERVSGFLFPNLTHSDEDGIDVSIPYYWNIAPNYDATIIPRVVGERGPGLEAEFRHMSSWQQSSIAGAILPEDKLYNGSLDRQDFKEQGGEAVFGEFQPADRWLGAVNHDGYLGAFRTTIDYTAVSDADYYRDLGSDLGLSSRRELERRGEIQYNRGGFFARLWAQRFQRLDNVDVEEYQRLPELELTYDTNAGPLAFSLGAKVSQFDRDTDGLNGFAAVTGSRAHVEPRIRLPLAWPAGFLTIGGGYRYTTYDLEQDNQAGGTQLVDESPDRGVGVGQVDGGLYFERDIHWFNQDLVQTLEPRLYYLWQEFEDQSDLPVFDATALTFSYNQLFRDNRFSGLDRIGDANQLSAGLTTRFISAANGREYFRASVGEIFYFEDRRVTLSDTTTVDERQTSSALAGEVSASLGGAWRVFGSVVWDPHDNEVDEGGGGIGYRRDNRHIFNIGFRNRRASDVEQTDLSLYWPISKSFAVVGRWNYDLISDRTIEGFGGLEYSDCCLQVRLMARRFLDSRTDDFADVEADDGIFLQIVFKGLAGFGTKVESVLERGVRGYRSPQASDYFSN